MPAISRNSPQTLNAGVELRVFRLGREIVRRFERDWIAASHIVSIARQRSALLGLAGDLFFLTGFTGVMALLLWRASHNLATVGDVVLALFLMQEVRSAVVDPIRSTASVGETLRVAGRILWLKDYTERAIAATSGHLVAPVQLREGIVFDRVSFRYPRYGTLGGAGCVLPNTCRNYGGTDRRKRCREDNYRETIVPNVRADRGKDTGRRHRSKRDPG